MGYGGYEKQMTGQVCLRNREERRYGETLATRVSVSISPYIRADASSCVCCTGSRSPGDEPGFPNHESGGGGAHQKPTPAGDVFDRWLSHPGSQRALARHRSKHAGTRDDPVSVPDTRYLA